MIEHVVSHTVQGQLAPCCQRPENHGPAIPVSPGLVFRRCRVCDRRHFEADAAPIRVNAVTGSIG